MNSEYKEFLVLIIKVSKLTNLNVNEVKKLSYSEFIDYTYLIPKFHSNEELIDIHLSRLQLMFSSYCGAKQSLSDYLLIEQETKEDFNKITPKDTIKDIINF